MNLLRSTLVGAMKAYEFTVIASGLDPDAPDFEDRFFEANCDDATLGVVKGRIVIWFHREGQTYWDAVASAIRDVTRAGATVESIEQDPGSPSQTKTSIGLGNQELVTLLSRHAVGALDAKVARDVEELVVADRDLARKLELLRKEITEAILLNEAAGQPAQQGRWSGLRAWMSASSLASSSIWSRLTAIAGAAASIASFGATREAVAYPFQSDFDAMSDDWNRVGRRLRHQMDALGQALE